MGQHSHHGWLLLVLSPLGPTLHGAAVAEPCPSTTQFFEVDDSAGAMPLAEATNCSGGGVFDVRWNGSVAMNETITVTDGSVLTVVGTGSDSIADGGGNISVFNVDNGYLNLTGLHIANGLGDDGAGIFATNGSKIWLHDTAFTNNVAYFGGAIKVSERTRLVLSGETLFEDNRAISGGAIFASDAVVVWSGKMTFTNNKGGSSSGAVETLGSNVTWSGETLFKENEAMWGGAILVNEGSIAWSGNTTFTGNAATGDYGGAITASSSAVSWAGDTVFFNNSAVGLLGYGGALRFSDCEVSAGKTTFTLNRALIGGAVFVHNTTITWSERTDFVDNFASTSGGAMLLSSGSNNITWTGETIFSGNNALEHGGAIAVEERASSSGLTFDGITTHFVKNVASSSGGALAIFGSSTLTLDGTGKDFVFENNQALASGGAIYLAVVPIGASLTDVTFSSNTAPIGGAVYSLASGTLVTDNFGDETEYPSIYTHCTFENNTATATGGAIETVAGKDEIVGSTFTGNTAMSGGALRLAGTARINDSVFTQNGAYTDGPAIMNIGLVESMAKVYFSGNVLLCEEDTFLDYRKDEDHYSAVCTGCPLVCEDCEVAEENAGGMQCMLVYDHSSSKGIGVTVETLDIEKGYWRATDETEDILPCYNPDACEGGRALSDYCNEGYEGPYCSTCADNYAETVRYTCTKCSHDGKTTAPMVLIGLFILLGCGFSIGYLVSRVDTAPQECTRGASRSLRNGLRRASRALPLQALKIVIVSWQILTQFDAVADASYPGVYGRFLDGISSLVSFDLGWVLSAGCFADIDFHDRFLVATIGPMVALISLGATYRVALWRNRDTADALVAVRRTHTSAALLISFLVYSSVSSTVFRMFACEELDDKEIYLRADYSIKCDSSRHEALQIFARFMIAIYPVGIPLLYGVLLFRSRRVLADRSQRDKDNASEVQLTADLWKPYKPSCYYYEVVECGRRIALTGVIVFTFPNTAAQVSVTIVLSFFFGTIFETLSPYDCKREAWLYRCGNVVVFLSFFQALLLKVDVSEEQDDSQVLFAGVLLAANVLMILAVIAESISIAYSSWRSRRRAPSVHEDSLPRQRSVHCSTWMPGCEDDEVGLSPPTTARGR